MKFRTPNRFPDLAALHARLGELAPDLDLEEVPDDPDPLAAPLERGGWRLSNRFVVQPMEGWDGTADGGASPDTLRRWRRFGESGAALIWGGEAFAVREDGKANPNQLCHADRASTLSTLAALRDALLAGHREIGGEAPVDWRLGLQLTHSGRWSRPLAGPAPRIAFRHPVLDPRVGVEDDAVLLSDAELEGIAERYVEVAGCAREVGFDFVDVKACHGYLLHELLAARSRAGSYGGDLGGRSRLMRRIIEEIGRTAPGLDVAVRLSVTDVVPHRKGKDGAGEPDWSAGAPYEHGFGLDPRQPDQPDWSEPLALIEQLVGDGVRWFNLTIGSPYWCPHIQRPASFPPSDGYPPPEDPLAGVAAHLRAVRRVREAQPSIGLVGSGWTYLQEWLPTIARHEVAAGHVDGVGLGRMILSYPDLPRDVIARRAMPKRAVCRTFSDCTTAPRKGLPSGCYPLDPHYKEKPEATRLKELKKEVGR